MEIPSGKMESTKYGTCTSEKDFVCDEYSDKKFHFPSGVLKKKYLNE